MCSLERAVQQERMAKSSNSASPAYMLNLTKNRRKVAEAVSRRKELALQLTAGGLRGLLCPYCGGWKSASLPLNNEWPSRTCYDCAHVLKNHPELISGDLTLRHLLEKHRASAANLGIEVREVISFIQTRLHVARGKDPRKAKKHRCLLGLFDLPVVPEFCPILPWIKLRIGLRHSDGRKWARYWASDLVSLDRIDSSFGYVPGNVMWVSFRANIIKRDSTLKELIALGAHASRLLAA